MHVQILGTRGIPSQHGGFETFAQDLALFLTGKGHRVTVYCQASAEETQRDEIWQGVRRILIPSAKGSIGSIRFDWESARHASREDGIALTLGYNTALFSVLYWLRRHPCIMNMDGLEWKRQKWSTPAKVWLWANEWLGARLSNHLIADHPMIAKHLSRHTNPDKIAMIPYGSHRDDALDGDALERYQLREQEYYLLIARPEPENSVLEIVSAYSAVPRKAPLVVLGRYLPENPYHAEVLSKAGSGVRFLGTIYDRSVVGALRRHARAYLHGHQVGGTNPSLVESLAAGCPVIAHDNIFTRWVVGESGMYFRSERELTAIFESMDQLQRGLVVLGDASLRRYQEAFRQENILLRYEALLQRFSSADAELEWAAANYSRHAASE